MNTALPDLFLNHKYTNTWFLDFQSTIVLSANFIFETVLKVKVVILLILNLRTHTVLIRFTDITS